MGAPAALLRGARGGQPQRPGSRHRRPRPRCAASGGPGGGRCHHAGRPGRRESDELQLPGPGRPGAGGRARR